MDTRSQLWGRPAALLLAAAACLALADALIIARYWDFYHLGGPGPMMALTVFYLPVIFVVLSVTGLAVGWWRLRAGRTRRAAVLQALAAAVCVTMVLIAYEVYRTADLRAGEGAGSGSLVPFLKSLVG